MASKAKQPKARKRITTTTEEIDPNEVEENEETEKLDDEVVRALTEMEGATDISWQVHRLGSNNPGYCRPPMSTTELTLENIARRHGPGNYRIKGVRSDGSYFKSATITIAEPYENAASAVLNAQQAQGTNRDQGLMPLLVAMMSSNTSVVTAALARPEASKGEFPWKEMLLAAPALVPLVKDFFTRKDDSNDSMDRLLKQLTIVEKLKGSDDGKGSTWIDIVRDAMSNVPAVVASVTRSANAAPATSAPAPATPLARLPSAVGAVDASTSAPVETPLAVDPAPTVEIQFFRDHLMMLVQRAAQNRNPELYAQLLLEELPDTISDELVKQLLTREDWFEQLMLFEERIAPYRGWFDYLRQTVLTLLDEESDDERIDPGATGSDAGGKPQEH